MAYTTIDNPSQYFLTKLYAGNGSTQNITGVGFQPDWVWIKNRSEADDNAVTDSVRGVTKELNTNDNGAESTNADGLTAFGSDGFSLGDDVIYNTNAENYVSWNWLAGTSFTNDASATGIGSIDSVGSVNTDAGFSIVSYTGTENLGTVKHGLGVVPSAIIFKNRSASANWKVYHKSLGATKGLKLDSSDALFTSAGNFNNTEPTSSVFTVNTDAGLNGSGNSIIAYCFADVKGYSKMGSFIGNGNANGPFIYLGFKPAWILFKRASDGTNNWGIIDNKRDTFNPVTQQLHSNLNNAEGTTSGNGCGDFLSNGWKIGVSSGSRNASGVTYIFLAFAENPFVTSTGIPGTAR